MHADNGCPDGTASDGCTAWPEGDWEDCCRDHDTAYRSGKRHFAHRRRADLHLLSCVAKKGYPLLGVLMFLGVRGFGWVPWHQNYRRWVGKKAVAIVTKQTATVGLVLASLLLASCVNVTTMKMKMRLPDGRVVEISSGKDVKIGSVTLNVEPGPRYVLKLTDYSSSANVDAINAQSMREAAAIDGAIKAVERGVAIGAKAAVTAVVP